MMRLFILLISSLSLLPFHIKAQRDSSWRVAPTTTISGFADVFYAYDLNRPTSTQRLPFLYNHNRHNAINLNIGLIRLDLDHPKYRSRLRLQTGTYALDNYAAEPALDRNIFEASIGFSMNRKNTIWLDAGIFPSNLGFESAISMDNYTLTRSLAAENSPYFLSGVCISYTPDDRWEFKGLLVNGWQRIQRLSGNEMPSIGSQIMYKATERLTLNWSTFTGTDAPDSLQQLRVFNNLYALIEASERLNLILGFDIGREQFRLKNDAVEIWYCPTLIAHYQLSSPFRIGMRAEYFSDEAGIIIPNRGNEAFQSFGFSTNFDYAPSPGLMCKIEGRWFSNASDYFNSTNGIGANNAFIVTSIAVKY